MKIAYLVNQYPKVSHSFIRREIAGVEACGLEVLRFSIRSCGPELVDEADKAEFKKTRVILDVGVQGLLQGFLRLLVVRPVHLLKALYLTLKLGIRSERGILKNLAYLAEACVLLQWLSELGIEHVHAHFGTNSTTVAMLCHELGGPAYSFTVHGPEEFDKVEAIALPEKIKRAAFVIGISAFGRSQLYRWCSFEHWPKIHIIRCGVDSSFLQQPITPIADRPTLVCVGRLCEQKGQLLLLEAVSQLVSEGLRLRLMLVGDGPLRPEIEKLISRYQLQDVIQITGWASNSEVAQYLLACRVMVLPSFAEGLPVVIMEALAMGRPVITTYVAGIPELVEPDVCGWLIPAGSIDALKVSMQDALKTPVEQLEQMGRAGAKKVAELHNTVIEAKNLSILFKASIQQLKKS